jgi:hypothetical protein
MFRIQARSAEYSRTLVTFDSSFSFEMIPPTNTTISMHTFSRNILFDFLVGSGDQKCIRRIWLWNSQVDARESAIVNFAVACWNWYLICISICNKSLLIQWLGGIHIILYNLILPIQHHKILSRLVSPSKIHKRLHTH